MTMSHQISFWAWHAVRTSIFELNLGAAGLVGSRLNQNRTPMSVVDATMSQMIFRSILHPSPELESTGAGASARRSWFCTKTSVAIGTSNQNATDRKKRSLVGSGSPFPMTR